MAGHNQGGETLRDLEDPAIQTRIQEIAASAEPGVQSVSGDIVDNTDPANPTVAGVGSVVAGTGIVVDVTDPTNPVVSASGVVSVVAGTNVTVDNTDPSNPVVSATEPGVASVVAGANVTVDNTDPANPVVAASGVAPFTVVAANFAGSPYTPTGGENTEYHCDTTGGDVVINYAAAPEDGDILRFFNINGTNVVQAPGAQAISSGAGAECVYLASTSAYFPKGTAAVGGTTAYSNLQLDSSARIPAVSGLNLTDVLHSVVAGANVTVDNTDPANPVVAAAAGGAALSTRGTATIGATDTIYDSPIAVYKQIILAAPGLLLGVSFHGHVAGVPTGKAAIAAVTTDVAGAPGVVLASAEMGYEGDPVNDVWHTVPVIASLPAGTYWIGVASRVSYVSGEQHLHIAHDAGGTDVSVTSQATNSGTLTTMDSVGVAGSAVLTSLNHSLYANILG